MQANLTPEKIELMDRYLDHELSDEELEAFEKELNNDPEMLQELKEYNLFRNNLSHFASQEEMLQAGQFVSVKRRSSKLRILKLLRVVIWLLIVLILFAGYLVLSGNDLFEVFFHPFKK